ncbi:hypothetical protein [Lewinella sp. IMCC34183]|uniref:hypothetical protein n=1 Tax=Lewinella sp. IMCC34183 TaxID=2248762 RepID=UPI000E21C853|nr:hypothetical protein [Lewinella sp. IMCC34183]
MKAGRYTSRKTLVWLAVLLGLVAGGGAPAVAQSTSVIQGGTVDILENGNRRGVLYYDFVVLGGKSEGDNSFDFSGSEEARVRLDLRIEGKNGRWAERMMVGIGPKSYDYYPVSMWNPVRRLTLRLTPGQSPQSIEFRCRRTGTSDIRLPFTFIDTNEEGALFEGDWTVSGAQNLIITPRVTVTEIGPKMDEVATNKPPTLQEKVRTALDLSVDAGTREAARNWIEKTVAEEFRVMVLNDSATETTEQFIERYSPYVGKGFPLVDNRVGGARSTLDKPVVVKSDPDPPGPRPGPEKTLLTAANRHWEEAVGQRDTALLNTYLATYEGVVPTRDPGARDSLICWTKPKMQVLDRQDGRERLKLLNFIAPAYYDAYAGYVTIDEQLLSDKHLLSIQLLRREPFELLIVDKRCPGKELSIALDNLMTAELTTDSVAGTYTFTLDGGMKPYSLRLSDPEGKGRTWQLDEIYATTVTLHRDSLQDEGLVGDFQAVAFSTGSDSPVVVSEGNLHVPPRPFKVPAWMLPALTVLAVGGLALLILYILRRGRSRQRTIFDEA